ncbi:MAG: hypothetical protein AB1560_01995 [Pseudomonadota bacterium]
MKEETALAIAQIKSQSHQSIYSALMGARELRTIKNRWKDRWQEALDRLGLDEVRAAYLIALIDDYDQRAKSQSHWEIMDAFMREGIWEKLANFQLLDLRRRQK